ALMEGGLPLEMDPETLDTLEETDLGVIPAAFSAHPHRVASLETTFNFGLRYGRKMEIDLFALPDEGAARKLGTVEAPWQSMVHDFIATDRHLLFLLGPATCPRSIPASPAPATKASFSRPSSSRAARECAA